MKTTDVFTKFPCLSCCEVGGDDLCTIKMFTKKIRGGKTLQSRKKVGPESDGLRNSKRVQDLRSTLGKKKATKIREVNSSRPNVVDARQKISVKKRPIKPNDRSISLLDERRKEQRKNLHLKNRSLTLSTGGSIQVTTRQEVPPDRMATMMGDSIQITAKVERRKEDMDRQANVIAGLLTVTAKNEEVRRKQGENQARKKERQRHNARKAEKVFELARRKEERERALQAGNIAKKQVHGLNLSEGYGDESLEDRAFDSRLDHSLKDDSVQRGRGSVTSKVEGSSTSKITVSNLHPAVTQQDVEELFGVIGNLKSCKMLGGGCAAVVYADQQDAVMALRRYHNRKLDGQPMQCKLNTLPSPSLYSPPPARLAPLVPLRPTAHSSPRPLLTNTPASNDHNQPTQNTLASRPVVFKVRI